MTPTRLYLQAGLKLSFDAPQERRRSIRRICLRSSEARAVSLAADSAGRIWRGITWAQWLVDDQREASGRPDVVTFISDMLTEPVKISGQPIANLVASTSGTTRIGW